MKRTLQKQYNMLPKFMHEAFQMHILSSNSVIYYHTSNIICMYICSCVSFLKLYHDIPIEVRFAISNIQGGKIRLQLANVNKIGPSFQHTESSHTSS